jgi:hypothetical protein
VQLYCSHPEPTFSPCHSSGWPLSSSTAPCAVVCHSHSTASTRSTPASSLGWLASSSGACLSSCSRPSGEEKALCAFLPAGGGGSCCCRLLGKHRASRISGWNLLVW